MQYRNGKCCPLFQSKGYLGPCRGDDCAWYDDDHDECAVLILAKQKKSAADAANNGDGR